MAVTLEKLLTHPDAFALTTAMPVQRAVCRIADGLPLEELADDPDVQWAVGGELAIRRLPMRRPLELFLIAAVRGAKTLISSALAFRAAITCDLSGTRRGEVPRVSVVSLDLDKAKVAIEHLTDAVASGKLLRPFFVRAKGDTVWIRHPTGRLVEIKVVAGKKAGGSLVSRWSAGAIFDEFPRMQGQEDGTVVNFEESRKAVLARLLPGCQLAGIGSPWAPRGPAFDAVQEEWGKPTEARVVIRARGPMLHPAWWTPERIAQIRAGRDGELIIQTDCEAEFGDLESQFFTSAIVDRCTRETGDPVPFDRTVTYAAFMDPAIRGNAWTLVIVGKRVKPGGSEATAKYEVAAYFERQGSKSKPLKNKEVFGDMKPVLARYGLHSVTTDKWSADSIAEHGDEVGIHVEIDDASEEDKSKRYLDMMALSVAEDCRLSLPKDATMRSDILGIRRQLTTTGMRFPLPLTGNGRHCDYAPSLVGAIDKARQGATWMAAATDYQAQQEARASAVDAARATNKPVYCAACQQFFASACTKHVTAA